MTSTAKLFKKSFFFFLLKAYIDWCFKRFYRLRVSGKSNIPVAEKVILASNHQNALMDALAIHAVLKTNPVFLARSDIFRNKIVAKILHFIKILPIYRIRDGYDQLANNQKVFKQTFKVLNEELPLAILPEGSHLGEKRLRPLKKGIARIALSYLQENDFQEEVKIIPIGLNYQSYHQSASTLNIRFGEGISVASYKETYKENPALAHKKLLDELSSKMQKEMLHIHKPETLSTISFILEIQQALMPPSLIGKEEWFRKQKKIIEHTEEIHQKEPQKWQQIVAEATILQKILREKSTETLFLSELICQKPAHTAVGKLAFLALASPFFLYGIIQNLPVQSLIALIIRKFKDPHFRSSVRFVGTAIFTPLLYLVQSLLVWLVFSSGFWAILYLLSLIPSMFFLRTYKNTAKQIRPIFISKKHRTKIIAQWNHISQLLNLKIS